jgi:MULE transposase domain
MTTVKKVCQTLHDIEDGKHKVFDYMPLYPSENEIYYYRCKGTWDKDYRRDGYVFDKTSVANLQQIQRTYSISYSDNNMQFKRIIDKLKSPRDPAHQPVVISYHGCTHASKRRKKISSKVRHYVQTNFDPLAVNVNQTIQRNFVGTDLKQIQNLTYAENRKLKLHSCPLKSVCEILKHSNIIWHLTVYPDLVIILGDDRLVELAKEALARECVVLEYDTTFDLGDFYLSYMVMQNTKKKPKFPVGFMIHTRKYESNHKLFWKILNEKLGLDNVIIATDREPGMVNAIRDVLPHVPQVFCYNHILRNVRSWLEKHNMPASICYEVRQMIDDEAVANPHWPKTFKEYFARHILPDILNNKKILPASYVTTNGIERYNRTIKDWCNHKQLDIDRMVLLLQWLQTFTVNQYCGNVQVLNLKELSICYRNAISNYSVFANEWKSGNDNILVKYCKIHFSSGIFHVGHPVNDTVHQVRYDHGYRCTCASSVKCLHILAVELYTPVDQRQFSGRLLQKTVGRKSGQKKPRRGDYREK